MAISSHFGATVRIRQHRSHDKNEKHHPNSALLPHNRPPQFLQPFLEFTTNMQAIVLHGKQDLRFDPDYPTPKPGPGEVLLRLTYSSICQTDIEMWQHGIFGTDRGPRILGHEAAGVVVELGPPLPPGSKLSSQANSPLSPEITVGTRVAVENVRTCGTCFFCLKDQHSLCENGRNFGFSDNGGLAEYGVWPAELVIPLPHNVTNEEAPLAEPRL